MVSQIRENDKTSKSWQDGGSHGSLAFPSICLAFKVGGIKLIGEVNVYTGHILLMEKIFR